MRGNKGTPNNNVMIRKNNYEELPEWMGRIQTLHSTPMARQRMAELQHHDEERRLRAESHPGRKRKIASSRLQKPANREEEPYMSQHPYVRTMIPDRSAMRDEPTVPHTSFQTVIGQVPWNTNSMRNDSNANTIPDISGVSLQTTQCHSHSYGDDRPPFSNRPTAVTERYVSVGGQQQYPKTHVPRQLPQAHSMIQRVWKAAGAFTDFFFPSPAQPQLQTQDVHRSHHPLAASAQIKEPFTTTVRTETSETRRQAMGNTAGHPTSSLPNVLPNDRTNVQSSMIKKPPSQLCHGTDSSCHSSKCE
jgi:hypothetical protein